MCTSLFYIILYLYYTTWCKKSLFIYIYIYIYIYSALCMWFPQIAFDFVFVLDNIKYKNKFNGNVGEPHTEGKNCDKTTILLNK